MFDGLCLQPGALTSACHVRGHTVFCKVHGWDDRLDTGVSEYANDEKLPDFISWIEGEDVLLDADEIAANQADRACARPGSGSVRGRCSSCFDQATAG